MMFLLLLSVAINSIRSVETADFNLPLSVAGCESLSILAAQRNVSALLCLHIYSLKLPYD